MQSDDVKPDSIQAEMRQAMAEAGIGPNDVLAPVCRVFARAADRVVLGPDPQGEERLALRVSAAITARVVRQVTAFSLIGAAVLGGALLALGIGIGWWIGAAQPAMTNLGPLDPRVVQMIQHNDLAAALDRCEPVPYPTGRPCRFTVWRERPDPTKR